MIRSDSFSRCKLWSLNRRHETAATHCPQTLHTIPGWAREGGPSLSAIYRSPGVLSSPAREGQRDWSRRTLFLLWHGGGFDKSISAAKTAHFVSGGISLAPKEELLCPFPGEQLASGFLLWRGRKGTIFTSSVTTCSPGQMQGLTSTCKSGSHLLPRDARQPVLPQPRAPAAAQPARMTLTPSSGASLLPMEARGRKRKCRNFTCLDLSAKTLHLAVTRPPKAFCCFKQRSKLKGFVVRT